MNTIPLLWLSESEFLGERTQLITEFSANYYEQYSISTTFAFTLEHANHASVAQVSKRSCVFMTTFL